MNAVRVYEMQSHTRRTSTTAVPAHHFSSGSIDINTWY